MKKIWHKTKSKYCLVGIIVLLVIFAIAISGCGQASDGTPQSGQSHEEGEPAATEQIYEDDELIKTGPPAKALNITADPCDDPVKTENAIATINGVLSRFPAELPGIACIEGIYVCEGLTSIGIPVPAASVRTDGGTIVYVDASAPRRIDASFTHELFHAIELSNLLDEEAWARINPYETYLIDTASPGEIVRYVPNMTPAFEPGFASDYARFSPMEDRAELFTLLYSSRGLSPKERAALLSDPFLAEKIAFLKDYLNAAGLAPECMGDNLSSAENASCFLSAYTLSKPELARMGPGEAYPPANTKAGQLLADSGFEKDGIKMLYDYADGYSRVYAPASALTPIEGETVIIEL